MALINAVKTEARKKLNDGLLKSDVRPGLLKTEMKLIRRSKPADRITLDEKIRRKAYEIFLRNGRQHGNDLAHWFEAVKQVKA